MSELIPRYEFRTFAGQLISAEEKMMELSPVLSVRESSEIYIVCPENRHINIKIRDGRLDIKFMLQKKYGLEQWSPKFKADFPISQDILYEEILPVLGVSTRKILNGRYSVESFLEEIIEPLSNLHIFRVDKTRTAFSINRCIAETARIRIDQGRQLVSASLESSDTEDILEAMRMTGLSEHRNINYIEALLGDI